MPWPANDLTRQRARLQQWIRQGALTIDGEPAKPTFKIKGGETFSLDAVTKTQAVVMMTSSF
jgi:23S rRNA-/tRNA-specific pseudouridylate synthase